MNTNKIQPKQIVLYTDGNFTSDSHLLIPSQKATKDFVEQKISDAPDWESPYIDKAPSVNAVRDYVDNVITGTSFTGLGHAELLPAGYSNYTIYHNLDSRFLTTDLYTATTNENGDFVLNEKIPVFNLSVVDDNTVQVFYNSATIEDTILVVLAAKVSANTSGSSQYTVLTELTYTEAEIKKSNSELNPSNFYKIIDFKTRHLIPYTTSIYDGVTEPLILMANSSTSFDTRAYSTLYNDDVINYDFENNICENGSSARAGYITYRKDTKKLLASYYDFRNVKYRRWELDTFVITWSNTTTYNKNDLVWYSNYLYLSLKDSNNNASFTSSDWLKLFSTNGYYGKYLIYNNSTPQTIGNTTLTPTSNYQDFFTFGSNCEKIEINKNTALNNNILGNDCESIIFHTDCNNNTIGNSCYQNTLFNNCDDNIIGDDCTHINIDNGCNNNYFGPNNRFIKLGKENIYVNLGDGCEKITTGNSSNNISIPDGSSNITAGNDFENIIIQKNSTNLIFADTFKNKTFSNTIAGIKFLISDTSSKSYTISGTNDIVVNMKSPDGNLWYNTIDNTGILDTQALA